MPAFLFTMFRLLQYLASIPYPVVLSTPALFSVPQSIIPFAFSCSVLYPLLPNALRFALSRAFLQCPCPCPSLYPCPCPSLCPCPALPNPAQPSPAQPSPAQPSPAQPVQSGPAQLSPAQPCSAPIPVLAPATAPVLPCPESTPAPAKSCSALPYAALPCPDMSFHAQTRAFHSVLPSCHALHSALSLDLSSALLCPSSCPPPCSVPALPLPYPVLCHSPCDAVLAAAPYQSLCVCYLSLSPACPTVFHPAPVLRLPEFYLHFVLPCTQLCPCTVLVLTPDLSPAPSVPSCPPTSPYSAIGVLFFFLPSPVIRLALPEPRPCPPLWSAPVIPSPCLSYPLTALSVALHDARRQVLIPVLPFA